MPIQSEPSTVPAIFLSDLSIIEQGTGKRSIIGIFDQFVFPRFPGSVGRFSATAFITNIEGSATEMELTTRIAEKGSGHVIFSSSSKIRFGAEKAFQRTQVMTIAVPINQVTFSKPGTYMVELLINGEPAGTRDFEVKQQPQKEQPPAQPQ